MGFHSYKRVVTHCNDGHSHSWQVKCMSTSRQTHRKCLTHTTWWNTRPLCGNDPPVILMHSQCITSVHTEAYFASRHGDTYVALPHTHTHVHTRALHNTPSFGTQCELPSAITEVHSCAHPTSARTLCRNGTYFYHYMALPAQVQEPHVKAKNSSTTDPCQFTSTSKC